MAAEPAAATAESAAAAEAAPGGSPGPTGGSPSFSLTVRFISGDTLTVTASAAEKVSDVCDRIGKERNWTAGTGKLVKGVKFLAGDKTLEEVGVDGSTSGLVATGVKEQPLPERLPKPEDDPFSLQPGGFGFHGAWGPQAGFGMHGKDMGFGDFGHHPRRQADWP
ncbi:hypothetical protein FNF27_04886 [Cafeteria roenbergensis]|uniref:Ubiquitin-like domain-containing protein n=1 Tax=Cafeteria roenbergensis TaxID=33653 RepID=A0A5A8CDY7_CAFRO|nr:hypothetical protein FNF29_05293 [Cafeteria roenbergensis]KAA0166958.1 hypothetical protein FNF28_03029 [Cafeteria roenbergensis]KAA0173737.1 hypothetical protein FNF27_04886 [Cafeteria roenbergensis]|eukprot:KAA0150280.1 hypothetical protein FNF29_05293 [Cafeteria roenbergensis]